MAPPGEHEPGLAGKLRAFAGDGIDYAEARLELLRLEARDSGARLLKAVAFLLGAAIAAHAALIGLLVALCLVLHRSAGLGWLGAVLIVAAGNLLAVALLAFAARSALRHPHFQSTLDELRKDRAWILAARTSNPTGTR